MRAKLNVEIEVASDDQLRHIVSEIASALESVGIATDVVPSLRVKDSADHDGVLRELAALSKGFDVTFSRNS